jgi:septal ring factor EnvC (AmiA/AmiB activator)
MFSALLLFHAPSKFLSPDVLGVLEGLNAIFSLLALGAAFAIFGLSFVLLLILSLHPKTRKVMDKYFDFRDLTELEELKAKVGNIENGLFSTNKNAEQMDKELGDIKTRLGSVENTLRNIEGRLDNTDSKLGSIETILNTLVNKDKQKGNAKNG